MTYTAEATMTKRSRPAYTTRARQTVQALTSGRTAQRQAREYAEAWYQALRRWDVRMYEVAKEASSGGGSAVLLTSGSVGSREAWYLVTPTDARTITEVETARTISLWEASSIPAQEKAGDLLRRIREGVSPVSLCDERGGWASPRQRSMAYAVAVLTLAVTLGDREAETHLLRLRKSVDSPTVFVDSEQ